MKKAELLSPAGNFECLKAAVNNGANAVYLGGKNFSARAFAGNFDKNELIEAVRYCHLHNVRVFVTLNTLLNEKELENAIRMADFYYENNVDALLVQDLGLFYILKTRHPDFELHCSTQMHVHNLEGVRNAKRLGFSRVVVARESTLDFIKEACREDIEIETFVHGAICVSYSGQCLMSSATKNRSANRGMCAQCCRLRYRLVDEDNNTINTSTDYLLSPRDMFLLDDIPKLIAVGVSSFKIEGRMKSPAYVGYVTSIYRKAIDSYYEGKKYSLSEEEADDLKVLFNRRFTDSLLYGKKDLFGQKTPNHLGILIGETVGNRNGHTFIRLERRLNQFDGIRIGEFGCIVNMLYKDDMLVNSGDKGDIVSIKTDQVLTGKVYKTLDHELERKIEATEEKKIPLDISVRIYPNEPVSVRLSCNGFSYVFESDLIPQKAIKAPLDDESIRKQFSRLNDTVYMLNGFSSETDDAFVTVKDLNSLRRKAIEAFDEYRLDSFSRKDNPVDPEVWKDPDYALEKGTMIQKEDHIYHDGSEYAINYVINPLSQYCKEKNTVISEFGGLLKDYDSKIAYYTLNCCNSYAYELLKRLGFDCIILSTELSSDSIYDLVEAYQKRNGEKIRPFFLTKGNRVLMYIKSDPFGQYMKDNRKYFLSDGNNLYSIVKRDDIYELIETEKPSETPLNSDFLPFEIEN